MGGTSQRQAACQCGHVSFAIEGDPITRVACYCDSCRTAGTAFAQVPGSRSVVDADGGTDLTLYRKDRVGFIGGGDRLTEHRLTPTSPTRRMVAACCGTPMFLEFTNGHWLSVYTERVPDAPPLAMRVMTADRPAGTVLADDVPSYKTHSPRFMLRLLAAWAAMGFRRPKVAW